MVRRGLLDTLDLGLDLLGILQNHDIARVPEGLLQAEHPGIRGLDLGRVSAMMACMRRC